MLHSAVKCKQNTSFAVNEFAKQFHMIFFKPNRFWRFFITCRNPTHLELFIFLSCLFGTVGSAVVPWCRDLWMLALMLHIEGWGQAFINTGT